MELVQPTPSTGRMLDASLVEAIFVRGLGRKLKPQLVQQLRAAGLDLAQPVRGPLPAEAVLEALRLAAADLFPDSSDAEAHRQLGHLLVHSFANGWKARATIAAARAMGVERTLTKLLGNHRTPSNFLEVELQALGGRSYAVRSNLGAPHPEILQGLAEGVLEALGARGAEVAIAERGEAERLEIHLKR